LGDPWDLAIPTEHQTVNLVAQEQRVAEHYNANRNDSMSNRWVLGHGFSSAVQWVNATLERWR
jgi:hypothetical protein